MTLDYARRGLRGLFSILILEGNHPPAHYLVIYALRRVSESDAALRIPSVAFGVGTTVALFVRCGGRKRVAVALGAAFAFAVIPLAVHLGQEVRPYSMALCFVAVADAARVRWRETRSRVAFGIWAAASVVAAYTLYIAIVALVTMLVAEAVAGWKRRREDPALLRAPLAIAALTMVSYLPWLWAIRHGLHQPPGGAPAFTPGAIWSELVGLAAGRDENLGRQASAGFIWVLWIAGALRAATGEKVRLGFDLAASTLGVLVALWAGHHWWNLRYLVAALLPLSRGIGEAFGWTASVSSVRLRRTAVVALALAILLVQAPALAENVESGRVDWRRAARYLEFEAGKGRRGEILAADGWAWFCLRAQMTRGTDPRDVTLAGSSVGDGSFPPEEKGPRNRAALAKQFPEQRQNDGRNVLTMSATVAAGALPRAVFLIVSRRSLNEGVFTS
jgi:4-amino-4-deoxy-L-arabinose transferase-like glycosyltransferase